MENNNSGFSKAEQLGRNIWNEKLIENHSENIYFTPYAYDEKDVFWEKGDNKYVGEIKFRYYGKDQKFFHTEGFLLEKTKYDELKRLQEKGYIPFYINILKDGNIFLFNLTNFVVDKWDERLLPKDSQNIHSPKIKKKVTYLNFDDAYVCKYDVNKY